MEPDKVLTLLKVCDLSNQWPELRAIHDKAMEALRKVAADQAKELAKAQADATAKAQADAAAKEKAEAPKPNGPRMGLRPLTGGGAEASHD